RRPVGLWVLARRPEDTIGLLLTFFARSGVLGRVQAQQVGDASTSVRVRNGFATGARPPPVVLVDVDQRERAMCALRKRREPAVSPLWQDPKKEEAMSGASGQSLSVATLFAERDARQRRDKAADEQLQQRKEEE